MHPRNSLISALVLGLISLSLAFSSVHSHNALQSEYDQAESGLPHTFQPDTVLCPICGYLGKADTSPPLQISTLSHPGERFFVLASHQLKEPWLTRPTGRSPPRSS